MCRFGAMASCHFCGFIASWNSVGRNRYVSVILLEGSHSIQEHHVHRRQCRLLYRMWSTSFLIVHYRRTLSPVLNRFGNGSISLRLRRAFQKIEIQSSRPLFVNLYCTETSSFFFYLKLFVFLLKLASWRSVVLNDFL